MLRAGNSPFDRVRPMAEVRRVGGFMQKHDEKDQDRGQAQAEDEQVICSNELLAAMRKRFAERKQQEQNRASEDQD